MSQDTSDNALDRLSYAEFAESGIFDKYVGSDDEEDNELVPVAPPRMKKIEKPDFDDLWKDLSIPVLHETPVIPQKKQKKQNGNRPARPKKIGHDSSKNERSGSMFSLMNTLTRKKKANGQHKTPKTPKRSRLQRFTLKRGGETLPKTPKSPRRRPKIKRTKTLESDSGFSLASKTSVGGMFSPKAPTKVLHRQQPTKTAEESGFFELKPFEEDDAFDDFVATPSKAPALPSLVTRHKQKKQVLGIEDMFDDFVLSPPKKATTLEERTSAKNSSNSAPPGFINPAMISREARRMNRDDEQGSSLSLGAVRKRGKNTF